MSRPRTNVLAVDGLQLARYAYATQCGLRQSPAWRPTLLQQSDLPAGRSYLVLLRLVLLLTVVPLVELLILLRLAEWFTWKSTIALVVVTGVVGAWLARREGLKALARIRADLAAGIPPAGAVVDGALILAAGLVLVTPGILTDICGFALLVPPVRHWVRRRLSEAFKKRMVVMHNGQHDSFIDVPATGRDVGNGEADQLE